MQCVKCLCKPAFYPHDYQIYDKTRLTFETHIITNLLQILRKNDFTDYLPAPLAAIS